MLNPLRSLARSSPLIWVITKHNLHLTLQNRQAWILLLLFPAVIIYFLGLTTQEIARSGTYALYMDVLDLDQTRASRALIDGLGQTNAFLVACPLANDANDGCALGGQELNLQRMQDRLAAENTTAYLVIPSGFESAAAGSGARVEVIFQPGAGISGAWVLYAAVLDQVTRIGSPALAAQISADFARQVGHEVDNEFFAQRLAEAQAASSTHSGPVIVENEYAHPNQGLAMGRALSLNGFQLSVPAISVMFVLISILGLTQHLAEERSMGVLARIGAHPVTRFEYLTGQLLAASISGVIQFGSLLLFGRLLGVDYGLTPWALLLIVPAFVLAAGALALALSTFTRSPEQAAAISTAAWVLLIPLGGGWWPLLFVPGWLQQLGHLSPVAWMMDALNTLVYFQGTLQDVALDGLMLLFFAVLFFVVAWRRFQFHPSAGQDNLFGPAPLMVDRLEE